MYQNWGYGYQYPAFKSVHVSLQSVCVPPGNVNLQTPPNTVSFRATEHIQTKPKKEGVSTCAKWAIGICATTALAIGADFLLCKGKHVKQLLGKRTSTKNTAGMSSSNTPKPNKVPTNTPMSPTSTPANTSKIEANTVAGGAIPPKIKFGEVKNPYKGHTYNLYNRTPSELKTECDVFKKATGAELHVPDTMASDLFGEACITLERAAKDGNFPKDIKHVLVGHGYGSSVDGTWSIIGRGGNVFKYINSNSSIKPGERVLVLCCESGTKVPGRNAVGDKVILSLTDGLHPGKIVIAGQNKVAGQLYYPRLIDDITTSSYCMYRDNVPKFTIGKK